MRFLLSGVLLAVGLKAHAQAPIFIPPLVTGDSIKLVLRQGTMQFYPGVQTATIGYNGAFLGPTIVLNKGQRVSMRVENELPDTTTTHWHGLHVAPKNDGGPHTPIPPGTTWSPFFPILNEASTCWYHPHLHMHTMEQVLMGAAGFIIVRDGSDSLLRLPRRYGVDDFPLVCQFKTLDPVTHQFVMSDEKDNTVMVNGSIQGRLDVPAQMVRLRVLNGSSHRYFMLAFSDNRAFSVIAGDGGLLDAPVSLASLMLAPGERAELLVDCNGQEGRTFTLRQLGTRLPAGYPGGPPSAMGMGGALGTLDNKDVDILTLRVVPPTPDPVFAVPVTLRRHEPLDITNATVRKFTINGAPMMSMTSFVINGTTYRKARIDFTTTEGSVMIWEISNQSLMPHPWHVHGNPFRILSINGAPAPAHLRGNKDVVDIPPMGGTIRIATRYEDFADGDVPYMYHCHILSHEDNGMMGQFLVEPSATSTSDPPVITTLRAVAYPNPSRTFWLVDGSGVNGHLAAQLVDLTGRVVDSPSVLQQGSSFSISIGSKAFPGGAYYLRLSDAQTSHVLRLLNK